MQNRENVVLATIFLSLVESLAVYGQTMPVQRAPPYHQAVSGALWMTEKWTGDEKVYTTARRNIEDDFSHGRISVPYLLSMEASWHQNEHEPLSLFRWAYARYKAQSLHPALPFTPIPGTGAFDETPSPHTYQYTRARFLVEIIHGNRPDLMNVGKRLLSYQPNDFDVEYGMTGCFHQYLSVGEKEASLTYASQLVQRYPSKPSVYAVKGGIYFSYWIDHRNKQDAQNAIKWYQQYLELAPANYEWRKRAKSIITLLQSHL